MKAPILLLAAAFVVSAAAPAAASLLQGDRFITAVKDNTVSGKTHKGTAFNLYFLAGGKVTYTDATGARDDGSWRLDPDGDVCVAWQHDKGVPRGCFHVVTHGRRLSWRAKSTQQDAVLRGSVMNTFLKPASP